MAFLRSLGFALFLALSSVLRFMCLYDDLMNVMYCKMFRMEWGSLCSKPYYDDSLSYLSMGRR